MQKRPHFPLIHRIALLIQALSATSRLAGLGTIGLFAVVFATVLFPIDSRAAGLAKTDWPTWGGNSAHNKISPSKSKAPLTILFRVRENATATYGNKGPVVGNGRIYVVTEDTSRPINDDNDLIAYDLKGRKLWATPLSQVKPYTGNGNNSITLADDGSIYLGLNDGLLAINQDGSVKFANQVLPGTQAALSTSFCARNTGMPVFDSAGRIIVLTGGNGDAYACDSATGNRIWRTNHFPSGGSGAGDGGVAIDSRDILYMHSQRGLQALRTADGTEVWRNSTFVTTTPWKNLALSPDERYLATSNVSASGMAMVNAATGQALWGKALGTGFGVFAFGLSDRIYIAADITGVPTQQALGLESAYNNDFEGAYCALDVVTGIKIWCVKTVSHLESLALLVDSNNTVYSQHGADPDAFFAFNADGKLHWQYKDKYGRLGRLNMAMTDDGKLFAAGDYLYGFRPWALTPKAEKRASGTDTLIKFTVKSSMLRRDPQEGVPADNQAQVVLDGKQTIPLKYLKQEGDDSVWEGTYKAPAGTDLVHLQLKGSVEAIAYKTQSSLTTHFANVPAGFQNTGMVQEFDLGTVDKLTGTQAQTTRIRVSWWANTASAITHFFKNMYQRTYDFVMY